MTPEEESLGRMLFDEFRKHANADGSRLGIDTWERQSGKRKAAWAKTAQAVMDWYY